MSDDGARSDRTPLHAVRDLGLLLFVAAALVAGLIHYSLARDDGPGDPSSATSQPVAAGSSSGAPVVASASSSPSGTAGATSDPTPSTSIGTSPSATPVTTTAVAATVTCWDGSVAPRLSSCRLPTGVAGLRWVFPSLHRLASTCHRAPHPAGAYRTVVGQECFTRLEGHPVTITFEQVASEEQAEQAIDRSYAGGKRFMLPGAHGGRCTWFDSTSQPARATGYYGGYPYVVSLYAARRDTVKDAWSSLVRFRPSGQVRGTRG